MTHGLGVVFSVAALSVLVTLAAVYGNAWTVVSCSIFGASMLLLYTASSLYHSIPSAHAKKILKKFDHIAIYYLHMVAGDTGHGAQIVHRRLGNQSVVGGAIPCDGLAHRLHIGKAIFGYAHDRPRVSHSRRSFLHGGRTFLREKEMEIFARNMAPFRPRGDSHALFRGSLFMRFDL